jgi:HK97 family phage prohead protease
MKNNFKLDSLKQFIDLEGEDLNENVLRKGYVKESQLKISDEDERTILADISTQDVDADGDIVIAKGCDFNRYLKNPIVTINHDYTTVSIVGSAKQIEVLDDRIRCKIKLNDTDTALNLWKQIKAGDIRGNSIGFVVKEAFIKGTKEFDAVAKSFNINKLDNVKRIVTKFLLIENSVVALPANPDALNIEVSKKSLDTEVKEEIKEEIKELKEEVKEVKEELPVQLTKILIIDRVGGLDIKKMYEDYKNGKII